MLDECKECGKAVSDSAVSCPKCGARLQKSTEENLLRAILVMVAGAIFVILFILVSVMVENFIDWLPTFVCFLIAAEIMAVGTLGVLVTLCAIRRRGIVKAGIVLMLSMVLSVGTYFAADYIYDVKNERVVEQYAIEPAIQEKHETAIKVLGYSVEGDIIKIMYQFTNSNQENVYSYQLYHGSIVFQDGISLQEVYEDDRIYATIKAGAAIETELTYHLRNHASPIEVEVYGIVIETINIGE